MLERLLPGERSSFALSLSAGDEDASSEHSFRIEAKGGKVSISASGTNELAAGLGHYLREFCDCVIGWPRGGGSRVAKPAGGWPDATVSRKRSVPWSYAMNVCTHSYSLVWYGWGEWEAFIDWMALSGINMCRPPPSIRGCFLSPASADKKHLFVTVPPRSDQEMLAGISPRRARRRSRTRY